MAIKKITELPEQTGQPAVDDLYVTVDVSETNLSQKTKKIRSDKIFIHSNTQLGDSVVNSRVLGESSVIDSKIGAQQVKLPKIDGLGASSETQDKFIFFDYSAGKLQYLHWPALTINDKAVVDKAQIEMIVAGEIDALAIKDGLFYFIVPSGLNGYAITKVEANILVASTSGTPTIQIAKGRRATPTSAPTYTDILSTRITIDVGEYSSNNAVTPPVINASEAILQTDDILRIDCDVTGTGTKGLIINLELSK